MSRLQTKLNDLMAQKKISAVDIEKKTGINRNTIYNILSGSSKNPSASNLQLITQALDISLDSLLVDEEELHVNLLSHEQMRAFADATNATINMVIKKDLNFSLNKLLSMIKEIYQYTIKTHPPKIDKKFIDWLIDKHKS